MTSEIFLIGLFALLLVALVILVFSATGMRGTRLRKNVDATSRQASEQD